MRAHRQQRSQAGARHVDGALGKARSRHHGDMPRVARAAVVELGGQPGVVECLPVTPDELLTGLVGDQLESVQARHAANLGQADRINPLVGTPVPAVTRRCSTSSTGLTEVPRTWRTPSAMPFMPWM